MSVYLRIAAKSFQRHLAYGAANLAGLVTNLFFGAIYIFVYTALYRQRDTLGGLDLRDAVTYAVITQSLLMVMTAFTTREFSEAVLSGDIVSDLSRPYDFYLYWGAVDLGRSLYYALLRGVPTFILGAILFRARLPHDAAVALWFPVAVLLGISVSFALRFMTGCLALWTTDTRGMATLVSTCILFFSGFIVPLNFFPAGLRSVVEWLPFRGLAHLPVSIYLGRLEPDALAKAFAVQLAWLVLLAAGGRVMLRAMMGRLSTHGG